MEQKEIPDSVFTYKDFEVLETQGFPKDGMLDIYAFVLFPAMK